MMHAGCTIHPSSFAEQIGHAYRAKCGIGVDDPALASWRPQTRRGLYGIIAAAMPVLKPREFYTDNHRLVYWDIGSPDADPVVLLHGFGASKENWLMLAPLLARHHRLLIPDIPGFGQSDFDPAAAYSAEAQVTRLQEWLAGLNPGPVHLVGSSMGGALAGALAAEASAAEVRSLTLMNSAGVLGTRRSPFELALLDGENHLVPSNYAEVVRLFRLATHRYRPWLPWMLAPALYREMVSRQLVNHRIFHDLLNSTSEPLDLLPKVRHPTFILWGERDQVLDASCTETLQRLIPHAQIRVLKDIGHLPMLETPRLTAASLQRFWRAAAPV